MARIFRSKHSVLRRLTIGRDTTLEPILIIRPVSLAGRKVEFGALGAAGVFDVGKGYDFSSGTGSYAIGFQGRYDYMAASHHVFGVEGDIWFPNTVSGSQTFTTAASGSGTYSETVQFSGDCPRPPRIWKSATGCSISLVGLPGLLTNLPARKSRARPLEAMSQPQPGKVSRWSRDTAALSARSQLCVK